MSLPGSQNKLNYRFIKHLFVYLWCKWKMQRFSGLFNAYPAVVVELLPTAFPVKPGF